MTFTTLVNCKGDFSVRQERIFKCYLDEVRASERRTSASLLSDHINLTGQSSLTSSVRQRREKCYL